MGDSYISTGLLTDGCKLILDRDLPLVSGKVRVTVEPIEGTNEPSIQQWQDFIDETYGCFSDAPIKRGVQGGFETRDLVE